VDFSPEKVLVGGTGAAATLQPCRPSLATSTGITTGRRYPYRYHRYPTPLTDRRKGGGSSFSRVAPCVRILRPALTPALLYCPGLGFARATQQLR
jgi:hypothetical protein